MEAKVQEHRYPRKARQQTEGPANVGRVLNRNAEATIASQILDLATFNGAKSQGRDDCGKLKVGNRADIVMIDLNAINNKPCFDTYCTLSYSANSSNVLLTMVDGEILYQNGEFTTIDIEKVTHDFDEICKHYFD